MKTIRFKPDCRKWIREGRKRTTFRKLKRVGIHEIVEGSIFKPRQVGMRVQLTLVHDKKVSFGHVAEQHYAEEGPFISREEFLAWLESVGLLKKIPDEGWLMTVELVKEDCVDA